jgi:branched-chain amino acid transport system ATP-binding protein
VKLLEIHGLTARYDAGDVVKGIDLDIQEGEIVTLLGSNGAGKSTTLRTISGLSRSAAGSIKFLGKEILGLKSEIIVRRGISHVPEGRRVFPGLTVRDNILLGACNRSGLSKSIRDRDADEMFDLFPDLERLEAALCWTLSGGQLQMVALARGLMAKPRLLLLDEPSLGLAPIIVQQVFRFIADIRKRGMTIFLIEQNANLALGISDRAYVLETGRILISGDARDLLGDQKVRAAYLGDHALTAFEQAV